MSTTQDRIKELVKQYLGKDDIDFEVGIGDTDVSSLDLVAFLKKVGETFELTITGEDIAELNNLGDLVRFIDGHR